MIAPAAPVNAIILASLCAALLVACASEPGASATIYVDAPPPGDNSCIGVMGFDVTISSVGRTPQTAQLVAKGPILAGKDCALPSSFVLPDLEIDAPISVTVTGYDGTGDAARVEGRQEIQSLREGPVHLQLRQTGSPPPVLVFYRNPLLQGLFLQDVTRMTIAMQMGSKPLLTVNPVTAGPFFQPEPGAYGVPDLKPDGTSVNDVLVVTFDAPGQTIKSSRLNLAWTGTHYTGM